VEQFIGAAAQQSRKAAAMLRSARVVIGARAVEVHAEAGLVTRLEEVRPVLDIAGERLNLPVRIAPTARALSPVISLRSGPTL
jgi:hypothetical protein